jgi:hypothetical protein
MEEDAMKLRFAVSFGAALVMACAAAPGAAFTPTRSIDVVVHSGPGAGNDVFARAIVGVLGQLKLVPQSMQVVNKTGGGGLVAMSYLGEKKGDDHLIGVFTGVWWVNPMIRKQANISIHDLTPIVRLILEPSVMAVRADSPYRNAKDFFEAAKKNPGKLKQSGGSISGRDNTTRAVLQKASGAEWQFISMKSGGERVAALLGGHVEMMIMEPSEAPAEHFHRRRAGLQSARGAAGPWFRGASGNVRGRPQILGGHLQQDAQVRGVAGLREEEPLRGWLSDGRGPREVLEGVRADAARYPEGGRHQAGALNFTTA